MSSSKPKPGRAFEIAVYEFAKTLDPNATVLFDPPRRDRDTQQRRQVDVWIEYRIGGHIPQKVLVSCKDKRRPIGVPDIGAFRSEVNDVQASSGVIYSRSGFTSSAVHKAEAFGIACCRLYDTNSRPADLPPVLRGNAYLIRPHILGPFFDASEEIISDQPWADQPWADQFDSQVMASGRRLPLIAHLAEQLHDTLHQSIACRQDGRLQPGPWKFVMTFDGLPSNAKATITVSGQWVAFAAQATLVHASHVMSTGHLRVVTLLPAIELTESGTPGPEWEIVEGDPAPGLAPGFAFVQPIDCVAFIRSVLAGRSLGWRGEPRRLDPP